jgi:exopolysaccharide production protein ExoQ
MMVSAPLSTEIRIRPAELLLLGLILLCVVGTAPFSGGGRSGLDAEMAEGSALRQTLYLVLFAGTALLGLIARGGIMGLLPPLPVLIFLFWAGLSVLWAIDPGISLRRFSLLSIVVLTVFGLVRLVGPGRSLDLLRASLTGVLLVNLISIPLVPQAVHLSGEALNTVGDWRGMFVHKNHAGAVTAFTALLLLHDAVSRPSPWRVFLLLLAAGFLVMTGSDTAFGFFLIAAVISLIYRGCSRSPVGRTLFPVLVIWAVLLGLGLIVHFQEPILVAFADPTLFTGRMALWSGLTFYAVENPLLGAGYASFWGIGAASPITDLVGYDHWTRVIGQGHNGYLDLAITLGLPGLLLGVWAFLLHPLRRCLQLSPPPDRALMIALWALFAGSNLLESFLARGDTTAWVLFLLATTPLSGTPPSGSERDQNDL